MVIFMEKLSPKFLSNYLGILLYVARRTNECHFVKPKKWLFQSPNKRVSSLKCNFHLLNLLIVLGLLQTLRPIRFWCKTFFLKSLIDGYLTNVCFF